MSAALPGYSVGQLVAAVFDPALHTFYAAAIYTGSNGAPDQLRFCEREAVGAWSCKVVAEGHSLHNLYLAVDDLGTAYLAYRNTEKPIDFVILVRGPGAPTWTAEYIDWNVMMSLAGDLEIGPDRIPTIVYGSSNDSSGAANFSMSYARRTPLTQ